MKLTKKTKDEINKKQKMKLINEDKLKSDGIRLI